MKNAPNINSALLTLFIGSFANNAIAEEPKQLTPAKELNTDLVDNIQENALEEPVRRNLLSAAVSYTTKNMHFTSRMKKVRKLNLAPR